MKQFLKNNLKVFVAVVLSGVLFTGIGVYATTQYLAKDITFTPNNEKFEVTNVEDALNYLYMNSINNVSLLETKTYLGDGVNNKYIFQDDYNTVIIQGDCRAADQNIYFNVTGTELNIISLYDSGLGVVMDKSWDRTQIYRIDDVLKGDTVNISSRYKGSYAIYGIK